MSTATCNGRCPTVPDAANVNQQTVAGAVIARGRAHRAFCWGFLCKACWRRSLCSPGRPIRHPLGVPGGNATEDRSHGNFCPAARPRCSKSPKSRYWNRPRSTSSRIRRRRRNTTFRRLGGGTPGPGKTLWDFGAEWLSLYRKKKRPRGGRELDRFFRKNSLWHRSVRV